MTRNLVSSIQIRNLHKTKTISATLSDNTLILVGENGSGKTTFLRILFYLLSGDWAKLKQFQFDDVTLTINGKKFLVQKSLIENAYPSERLRHEARLSQQLLWHWTESIDFSELSINDIRKLAKRRGLPEDFIENELIHKNDHYKSKQQVESMIEQIKNEIDSQILYLPTYRRIERDLANIFDGTDADELRKMLRRSRQKDTSESFIELVEFGMKDVQKSIDAALTHLKEYARDSLNTLTVKYLGDVVSEEYQTIGMKDITKIQDESVHPVLERLPESILSADNKHHLLEVLTNVRKREPKDDHEKIICHYFLKLFQFQKELRSREKSIADFAQVCNQYILDKHFLYDSLNFQFAVTRTDRDKKEQPILISDLSSGEKQIVSLFSHLYLSGLEKYFVLIDEPELSLSVPWQRRFLLDIHNSTYCAGLIAVTHSPFIYDNELRKYAHSLGEFSDV